MRDQPKRVTSVELRRRSCRSAYRWCLPKVKLRRSKSPCGLIKILGPSRCFSCGLTPELSRPAKRVRLGRLVMRAKVNPKPLACNGSGRTGSTEERSASSGQVEASKDRSRQRRQSEGHETILVPSGANAVHPKPSEAKPEGESEPNRSVTDQRRRQRRNVSR